MVNGHLATNPGEPEKPFTPAQLDKFFPKPYQELYVAQLMQLGGLTRVRAQYFTRLWAYLVLKPQWKTLPPTLTILSPTPERVVCTHREAAELFYAHQERGSDRAAGLMIDRFVALGLLEKYFDGQFLCLKVRAIPELAVPTPEQVPVKLISDRFNPRTDTIPIANLITRTYAELMKDQASASHKTVQALRAWAQCYPKGLRVLRRSDNNNAVSIAILFPVAAESESHFFQTPVKSYYLSTNVEVDPFVIAAIGDPTCTAVYVRAWVLDPAYLQLSHLHLLLEDTRETLAAMQEDFPNLCDVYSLIVHPLYEELRQALGFQKTFSDSQRPHHWIYLALDHFLSIDLDHALSKLRLPPSAPSSPG